MNSTSPSNFLVTKAVFSLAIKNLALKEEGYGFQLLALAKKKRLRRSSGLSRIIKAHLGASMAS